MNIRGGGDFTGDPRFATGLTTPVSICQGPGDNIYVAEQDTGEVTIITAGGDFTSATAFATGLELPTALLCSPDRILVSEILDAEVIDITAGGDFTGAMPFARLEDNLNDLLRDADGTIWACSFNDGVIDVTDGGDLRNATYFAPNDLARPSLGGPARRHLAGPQRAHLSGPNFTAGGNMARCRSSPGDRADRASHPQTAPPAVSGNRQDVAVVTTCARGDLTARRARLRHGLAASISPASSSRLGAATRCGPVRSATTQRQHRRVRCRLRDAECGDGSCAPTWRRGDDGTRTPDGPQTARSRPASTVRARRAMMPIRQPRAGDDSSRLRHEAGGATTTARTNDRRGRRGADVTARLITERMARRPRGYAGDDGDDGATMRGTAPTMRRRDGGGTTRRLFSSAAHSGTRGALAAS